MASGAQSIRSVRSLICRFAKPDQEMSVNFTAATTLKFPNALRTDKFISALILHFRGRITIGTASFTAVGDALRYLIQEIRVYGTHAQWGPQTIIKMFGKTQTDLNKMYRFNYTPRDKGTNNALTLFNGGTVTAQSYDVDIYWTLPLFPMHLWKNMSLAPFYSVKGPDWAGNLYCDIDTGDGTAFGTLGTSTVAFTAFGSGSGSPLVQLSVIRPIMTVDLMNRISPAVCWRTRKVIDSVAQGVNLTASQLTVLNIGKRFVALWSQAGTLQTGTTAGVRSYASFSDAILTRQFLSIDGKPLVNPYNGLDQQEWDSIINGFQSPVGYVTDDFCLEAQNPDSAFPAQTLTAARRFEVDGDLTAASNQGLEFVQEELAGTPALLAA